MHNAENTTPSSGGIPAPTTALPNTCPAPFTCANCGLGFQDIPALQAHPCAERTGGIPPHIADTLAGHPATQLLRWVLTLLDDGKVDAAKQLLREAIGMDPSAPPPAKRDDSPLTALHDALTVNDSRAALTAYVAMRRKKRYPVTALVIAKWANNLIEWGEAKFAAALVNSTTEQYRALVPLPLFNGVKTKPANTEGRHAAGF